MEKQQVIEELHSRKPVSIRMRASSLKGFNFSGMDLTEADLSFSNLSEANFDGANLTRARVRASNLSRATFRNADLTHADFSYSNLEDTDMAGANLTGINLYCSNKGTSFHWSDLNLVALIQSQSWLGMVVAMFFGAVFVYGVSGIVYFTNLITAASDPLMMRVNQYVVVNNILSGLLTVLITYWLTPWLDRQFNKGWHRHAILSLFIVCGYLVFATVLYSVWGRTFFSQIANNPEKYGSSVQTAPWYFYVIGPMLVANLFYYLTRQGHQLSRKITEQEYQLLNLEKLKTRAELSALQAKINPHFLYNSLNSIASLVHENPDKAETMTVLLSKLFRYTTGRTDDEYFGTIEDELEMVDGTVVRNKLWVRIFSISLTYSKDSSTMVD